MAGNAPGTNRRLDIIEILLSLNIPATSLSGPSVGVDRSLVVESGPSVAADVSGNDVLSVIDSTSGCA